MSCRFLIVVVFVLLNNTATSAAAKILGCPLTFARNSALRNDEKILAMIAEHGHDVYVLADNGYQPPAFLRKAGVTLITYPRSTKLPQDLLHTFSLRDIMDHELTTAANVMKMPLASCESFLNSTKTHSRLKAENFELVYYNAILFCKYGIQRILGDVPAVEFMPHDFFRRMETRELPYHPSYMVSILNPVGQNMTFTQRFMNVLWYCILRIGVFKMTYDHQSLVRQFNMEPKFPESLALVYGGFPLENPAPYLPDVVYLNGILATQPEPLEKEMEEFVQSSGDHGIILMSFGSMIKEYDEYYGNLIANAFAKMPQKIVWKYEGPTPKNLGRNIKLVKWLPQTALLGHTKTKLFVTHCGQNSMYEAAMFGVPVVALPIDGDQHQNAARLTLSHRMGVGLDIKTMTTENFEHAIRDVISNPVYKENALHLSAYLKDQPISGRDLLLYWIDYVIRHRGISHLKAFGRFLPWYQYYLLDVATVVLAITVFMGFLIFRLIILVNRCCCKRWSKTKKE